MEKLFKITAIVFLVVVILAIPLFKTYITINYFLKQKDIANKLCVNKFKPELQCHGKCFLKLNFKKISLEEKDQKENFINTLKNLIESEYISNCYEVTINIILNYKKQLVLISNKYSFLFSCVLFHPPTFV